MAGYLVSAVRKQRKMNALTPWQASLLDPTLELVSPTFRMAPLQSCLKTLL